MLAQPNALSRADKESRIKIYTLGRFMVYKGSEQLSLDHCRSRKLWDLFMYFIAHREKPICPESIAESLWPGQNYENQCSSVKNLVYRLRKRIDHEEMTPPSSFVINVHGCYVWNSKYSYWLDIEVFEKLCLDAQEHIQTDPALACKKYCQATSLYRGDFYSERPYNDWLLPVRHYYRQLYFRAVTKLLLLLREQKLYSQMLEECEKAFKVEHFEEELHLRYIEALLGIGNISQARAHYEYISTLLYKELNARPSPALRALYRNIQEHSDKSGEIVFSDLREMLQERDDCEGAICCEPELFRILYRMERRRAEREDRPIQVGLLTLSSPDYRLPPGKILQESMDIINEILTSSLRKGDVYTLWNDNQFAMLLPGATQEEAEMVIERARGHFMKEGSREDLLLHSSIHPLFPFEHL